MLFQECKFIDTSYLLFTNIASATDTPPAYKMSRLVDFDI